MYTLAIVKYNVLVTKIIQTILATHVSTQTQSYRRKIDVHSSIKLLLSVRHIGPTE